MIRSSPSSVCTRSIHVSLTPQIINHVEVDAWTRSRWQELLLAPSALHLEGSTSISLAFSERCIGQASQVSYRWFFPKDIKCTSETQAFYSARAVPSWRCPRTSWRGCANASALLVSLESFLGERNLMAALLAPLAARRSSMS